MLKAGLEYDADIAQKRLGNIAACDNFVRSSCLMLTLEPYTWRPSRKEHAMQLIVGDVVHLKSYPTHRMTVIEVDGSDITCRWFEGAIIKEGTFAAESIAKDS
jgi:uncharacterized protein YodC (DUF2158 family)